GGDEAFVKAAEGGLAERGGTGCHVEGGSHGRSSAGDGAGSLELSTVVIKRGEGCDGAAGGPAELGQQGDEHDRGGVLYALDGLEQFDLGGEARNAAAHGRDERRSPRPAARARRGEALLVLCLEDPLAQSRGLVADGDALVDQPAPVVCRLGQALTRR